jgi:hypothetical protein
VSEFLSVGEPGRQASAASASYLAAIRAAQDDPQQLEQLYQSAVRAHQADQFASDLVACYEAAPANLLYGAWYYRLQAAVHPDQRSLLSTSWFLAAPLSVLLGAIFWLISDLHWTIAANLPYVTLLWSPIAALFIVAFLSLSARQHYPRFALAGVALAVATAYILALALRQPAANQQTYLLLMLAHLPLISACVVGAYVVGWRSTAHDRFAFLTKAVETIGTAGVYGIAGGIFVGLTVAMFQALNVAIPDIFARLLVAGGAGLIPVLAVASVYNPSVGPSEQEFGRGFGKILVILMQALLPLTLIVLVIYLGAIPFNFWQPFANRNVLIIYNALLFAIMGLLIGVTPISAGMWPARYQRFLRAGILLLAVLVIVVSAYALAAIVYRTAQGELTMNRLAVIGWNTINIAILLLLLGKQLRLGNRSWVDAVHSTAGVGVLLYVAWGAFVVLAFPWLF